MSWQVEKALDELMSQETGAVVYPFGTRRAMAICYPNTYDVAMSNLGDADHLPRSKRPRGLAL